MSDLVRTSGQPVVGRRKRNRNQLAPASILEFESPTRSLIALPVPFSARLVSVFVGAMVLTCLLVVAVVPIDVVVTAAGKLTAKSPAVVVQPLDVSVIRAIDVHEGEMVKAGQLLARLDPTLTGADLAAMQASVDSLQAEMDRLEAEASRKPYITSAEDPVHRLEAAMFAQRSAQFQAQRDTYREKINSLETQIAGNLAAASYYRQRLAVAEDVEEMRKELERLQVGSKLNTKAATDARIDMMRSLAGAQSSADTGKRDLQEMVAERDQAEQQWFAQVSQNLTDQGRKLSDAKEQLKKARLHNQLVELRAPEDGTILSIAKVSVGSVLQSGDQLITMVPLNAALEAQVFVQGTDAGWPAVGNPATVKFDAFPFTVYGYATGKVERISADSFTQQDASPSIGDPGPNNLRTQQTFSQPVTYRATVSLDDVQLHNMPPGFHLVPGMPITADVKVGKRTVLLYMLGHIVPVFSEGMREQ